MDADKVNEAARENVRKYPHQHRSYTFRQGADWLMQQPLADRLTDEEKEKIRNLSNLVGKIALKCEIEVFNQELQGIFGKELFNQPTEL